MPVNTRKKFQFIFTHFLMVLNWGFPFNKGPYKEMISIKLIHILIFWD